MLQTQLLTKYGYPAETHTVLTADGFFLTLHRIPYGRHNTTQNRHPVILQHGILGSSADWLVLGPDKAFGMCFIEDYFSDPLSLKLRIKCHKLIRYFIEHRKIFA
jgi:pimeloyl-ACP methyl ester carboxylesterase